MPDNIGTYIHIIRTWSQYSAVLSVNDMAGNMAEYMRTLRLSRQ